MAKSTPAARLRRTFRYPSDDDDDNSSLPEVLDEQEQESLIESLALQNAARNKTTHTFLSVFPPLSAIPFLIALFFPPSHKTGSSNTTLVPLLGLSSLAATSWMLYHLNVTETGFPFLDSPPPPTPQGTTTTAGGTGSVGSGYGLIKNNKRPFSKTNKTSSSRPGILGTTTHDNSSSSPLTRYLPFLNIALALLTLLSAFLQHLVRQRQQQAQNPDHTNNSSGGVNPLLLGALPGIVYAVTIGAKMVMASVDPERELSGLKYRYKGA
ncbi:hypothetical protein B0J18DRAFT_457596 [Chaetomium sp. MPI-SDFR-AT-0129]|nr:hypothetical protein B0J18DRAFT_457596 [Chaetomium sp. MPI-SDFR-AT-0129]